jgi:putative transcriptional regulator
VPSDPFAAFDPYGGAAPPGNLRGQLLVATPRLGDADFARRTVLVLDHGDPGTFGVVIDDPGGVPVGEVLPRWQHLATPPTEIFTGGPVGRGSVVGLVRLSGSTARAPGVSPCPEPEGWTLIVDDDRPLGTVDLGAEPIVDPEHVVGLRLFSGYAGWGPGQLDAEIDDGAWFVLPARANDPISADPEGLWRRVLRRQGGALALVSGYPHDPATN